MCGILGAILAEGVTPGGLSVVAADGLTALQHRGTESSGLVGSNGVHRAHFEVVKGGGYVREVYNDENLSKFKDSIAILGHNRYSTAGMKTAINCIQPFIVHTTVGLMAIAHNGELVDANRKRNEILHSGVGLSTDTDSELIAQIISKSVALNMNSRQNDSNYGDISKGPEKDDPTINDYGGGIDAYVISGLCIAEL
ncbi:Amidophosphoribosyltransferase [Toxocara canis]|uniref:Amidophosphoribosyltransferase n=1 Tax=Toxocara canis TaxID=6265 RepID=A0A0B2W300_TOXCA|nr:Amidophosphoribosyltransferase [Toxocara canis]